MKGAFWKEGSPVAMAHYLRPVYYYETDRMGCVHHSNYIRWFEEARIHLMRERGFPYEELEGLGILSPVLTAQAEYKSMTRFGETVDIAVDVESYTGTRIAFRYEVRDRDTGALRCQGRTAHCFLGGAGHPVSLKKAAPAYHQKVCAALAAREQEEWQ